MNVNQKGLYYYKAPFYKHFRKCGLFFLLMLALMISGCGNSNYGALSNENSEETETKNDGTTVREHWTTTSRDTDPITVELSIVADKDDHINCDGIIYLTEDASTTGHPMSLSFENTEVTITDNVLMVTGTGLLVTKDSNGFIIQPLSEINLVITKRGSEFNCDVIIDAEELVGPFQFDIEIFRSSAAGALSFITSTWAKQSPGVVVHFPRKLYSSQHVSTGLSANDLLSFQLAPHPGVALVSGQLHIPSNLSPNGDDIKIDIRNVFAYINEDQHTFKFYQAGTVNTLNSEDNSVDTAYSLLVTVTAKSVFAYSDEDDELILGRKNQYSAKITLILDRSDTDQPDERTTLITEIKRTDIEDTISDEVQYPPLSGGTFVLEGQKTYSLYHAESSRETEDTVKTTSDKVKLNLSITYVNGEGLWSEGSLSLDDEACPANKPALFVNLNGIIPVFDEDGSFRISSPVILVKEHSSSYSTYVNADISLLITKQENGEFLCDATLTSDDLETAFTFTTKANYHFNETTLFPITCSLVQESSHILSWFTEGILTGGTTMADSNTKVDTTFSWTVDQGTPSVKASGAIGLELNTDTGPRPFEFFFYNADVAIFEDGKRITITGKWYFSSYLPSPLNDFTINLYETESGAAAYTVSLFLPPSMFVDGVGHTVEFFVMADHISGANELFNIIVGIEADPLSEVLNKALITGRLQ